MLCIAFEALEKASDQVSRDNIWWAMRELGEKEYIWLGLYSQCIGMLEVVLVEPVTSF